MNAAVKTVTRFAPSPTGRLHVGHAYSALFAADAAKRAPGGGEFLLRIEDIDDGRCQPQFETAIINDLKWLGLDWPEPVRRQSDHMADYADALGRLKGLGLLYPCFCSRAEIRREIAEAARAPHDAPHDNAPGSIGPLYPGTCRGLGVEQRQSRIAAGEAYALRLDTAAAIAGAGPLIWTDRDLGKIVATPEIFGDVVLARKDIPTCYHMAVTIDDHRQGVTLVTRGDDLRAATHLHRLLQALLGLDTPDYRFHALVTGADGVRLAKRDESISIASLRDAGRTPQEVMAMAGWDGGA